MEKTVCYHLYYNIYTICFLFKYYKNCLLTVGYCIITPDHVKTFTEQRITYEMATTMVPLIECNNNTRVGLLTKRSHDTVDFKLWIDDDIFKVSKTYDNKNEKGYTVKINDNIVEDNVYNIDFT